MSVRWAVPIAAVLLTAGFLFVVDCTDDLEAVSEGQIDSLYYKMDDQGNLEFWGSGDIPYRIEWDGCTTVTVKNDGISFENSAFHDCDALTTVTVQGSVGSIGDNAFLDCAELNTVTMTGPITSIGSHAFQGCFKLQTLKIACNDPLNITKGNTGNGYIAHHADTVNYVHRYSAAYDWADDGKSCTVHIVCANTADHNHDVNADVTSTVKIQPTETTMGTTEYSVSGTYNGFAYSDTKDVQDIPATGSDEPDNPGGGDSGKKDNTLLYIAAGGAIAAIALIGAAFFLLRRRP